VTRVVLGLDQGTSSTRCLALDERLEVIGTGSAPVSCSFPGPGLVEQDPDELAASASRAIADALDEAGVRATEVAALGIANQTETFLVCDRSCGRPIHPAIVWQDRRTSERCQALVAAGHEPLVRSRTGLELDPTFSATKLAWVLDNVDGARDRAQAGELAFHDVAGWLARSLAGIDVCDVGNAGRTLLTRRGAEDWDDELLELFEVPRGLMPPIVDSDRIDGTCSSGSPLPGVPLAAALGDQQASLFGLGCFERGQAKLTLGTGAFLLVQAGGDTGTPPDGVLGSCAWRLDGLSSYAFEGFIPTAGSAVDWFAGVGTLPPAVELDALLADAGPEDGSIMCVPALQGLGTPSWDAEIRGGLLGITRASTRAQLTRAVVDGVVHQVADALAAIATRIPLETVFMDGGMARSDWVLQRVADLACVEVRRAARPEATAIGAAMAAGLAVGQWEPGDFGQAETDRIATPAMPDAERDALRSRWAEAVELVGRWRR
jgi:glycerol kinase